MSSGPCSDAERAESPVALADGRVGVEDLPLLVLRELVDEGARAAERIRLGREPLHEPRAALEELLELLDRQLPR